MNRGVLFVAVLALVALLLAVRAHSSPRTLTSVRAAVPRPFGSDPQGHSSNPPALAGGRATPSAGSLPDVRAVPRVVRVICAVFHRYCGEAIRVAWCESHWKVSAHNGQYLGLFQMGAWERAHYGHGPGAWAQSRAAYRYFTATGRTWRPWTCRP